MKRSPAGRRKCGTCTDLSDKPQAFPCQVERLVRQGRSLKRLCGFGKLNCLFFDSFSDGLNGIHLRLLEVRLATLLADPSRKAVQAQRYSFSINMEGDFISFNDDLCSSGVLIIPIYLANRPGSAAGGEQPLTLKKAKDAAKLRPLEAALL